MMNICPSDSTTIKQSLIKLLGIYEKATFEQAIGIIPPVVVICKKIVSWFPPTSKALIPSAILEVTHKSLWDEIIPTIISLAKVTPFDLRINKFSIPKENKLKLNEKVGAQPLNLFEKPQLPPRVNPANLQKKNLPTTASTMKLGRIIRKDHSTEAEFRIDTGTDENCFGKGLLPYVINRKPAEGSFQVHINSKDVNAEGGELMVSANINNQVKIMKLKGIINSANNMSVISTNSCALQNGKGYFQFPNSITTYPCYDPNGFAYAAFRLIGRGKSLISICSQLGFKSRPPPSESYFIFACHLKFGCAGADTLCDTLALLGYAINRSKAQAILHDCNRCVSKTLHSGPPIVKNDFVTTKKSITPPPKELNTQVFSFKRPRAPSVTDSSVKPNKRTKDFDDEANKLGDLLFGAVDMVYDADTLVFDHAVLKSSYLLCGKLEKRGLYFVDYTTNKNELQSVINVLTTFKSTITAVHCDNAKEFLSVKKKCDELGISFTTSSIGRDVAKGRQESVVKVVKLVYAHVVDRLSKSNSEFKWHPKC